MHLPYFRYMATPYILLISIFVALIFVALFSGIEMALGNHWKEKNIHKEQKWEKPAGAETLLVASGSCSPVTSGQIVWALKNGFIEIYNRRQCG